MAFLARTTRLRGAFGGIGFGGQARGKSTLAQGSSPELASDGNSCFLLGFNGPIRFSRDRLISTEEFMNSNPFVAAVPSDRLITRVKPARPHMLPGSTRTFVRSGLIPLYICQQQGISIPDAFRQDNVGVIDGLGLLAFKELKIEKAQEDDDMPGKFHDFLKDLICKHHGPSTLNELPVGLEVLMRSLDTTKQTAEKVHIDERQIYHPALFSNDLLASIYFDGHRFLRHELPALGAKQKALAIEIMTNIDNDHPHALKEIMKYSTLKIWIGAHHPNARHSRSQGHNKQKKNPIHQPNAGSRNKGQNKHNNKKSQQQSLKMGLGMHQVGKPSAIPVGSNINLVPTPPSNPKNPKEALMVDIHRHPVARGFDEANVKAVKKLPAANLASVRAKPYTISDIVELLIYKFPLYPQSTD